MGLINAHYKLEDILQYLNLDKKYPILVERDYFLRNPDQQYDADYMIASLGAKPSAKKFFLSFNRDKDAIRELYKMVEDSHDFMQLMSYIYMIQNPKIKTLYIWSAGAVAIKGPHEFHSTYRKCIFDFNAEGMYGNLLDYNIESIQTILRRQVPDLHLFFHYIDTPPYEKESKPKRVWKYEELKKELHII